VKLIEEGPVRARVKVEKRFGTSRFTMYISLYAYTPRVDFEVKAFWNEEYRFAKIGFAPSFKAPYATYEIAYGAIQRYAHTLREPRATLELPPRGWEEADVLKFEVAAHTWVDVSEPEGSRGFTLLNDGRYGFSYDGEVLWLSFLRAANRPRPYVPLEWTDRSSKPWVGEHSLRYAVQPHRGDWRELNPARLGLEFNNPLIPVVEVSHPGTLPPTRGFMEVSPANVVVTAVKKAEDGDEVVVRLYEASGRQLEAQLDLWFKPVDAWETDLVEWDKYVRPVKYTASGSTLKIPLKPFEIKTIKLKPQKD